MKSPVTKLAAAAVVIVAVLIGVKILGGSGEEARREIVKQQDIPQKEIIVEIPKETKSDLEEKLKAKFAAEKLEAELRDIEKMFAAGNVTGLIDMLDKGQWEAKVAAANYLAEVGDLTAIESLEILADKWEGALGSNPFAVAINKMRERAEQQSRENATEQSKGERETKAGTKTEWTDEADEIIMLKTVVKVVDEEGHVVADAEVKPDGLRIKASRSGHYGWIAERHGEPGAAVTDSNGLAEISYPKYVIEKLETGAISFSVRHPEYCATRETDYPIEGEAEPVVLRKGAIVRVSGYIGNKKNIPDKIYPQVSSNKAWILADSWEEVGDGIFENRQIEAGPHYLRLVHFSEGGEIYFSETILFKAEKNELHEVSLELKPGVRVEGRVDDSVARPVIGGRVVAVIAPAEKEREAGFIAWRMWSEIDGNGRFVFESLPWDTLQLTGLCDGFVSASPKSDERFNTFVMPQLFYLDEERVEVNLVMERSATCEVRVVNDGNEAIEGARVAFWPNVLWQNGGSQVFAGFLLSSEDFIRNENGLRELIAQSRRNDFKANTNKDGIAVVRNLPGFEQSFLVSHDDYEMPPVKGVGQVRRRAERILLVSGETAKVTVKMQKKGTDVLGEGEGENVAEVREPRKVQTSDVDEAEDYVGLKVVSRVKPEDFEGYVVDDNDNPLERVLVDAWTWYGGNETYTDANGFFQLGGFDETRTIEVRFSKEGYSPQLFVRQPLGVKDAVVILNNKTYFEGTVMTLEGEPVAGALIRANQWPKEAEGGLIGVWTETESDKDGNYLLYVDDDTYEFQVKSEAGVARYENVVIEKDEGKNFDIVLDLGLVFRAIVLESDTNEPVEGVRLFNWQHKDVEGTSGPDGVLEIGNMIPGNFEFQMESKEYVRWWSEDCLNEWMRFKVNEEKGGWQRNFDDLEFEIQAEMEPVTIFVERGVRIFGQVLDPFGNPVAGATVAPALTGTGNSITGDTRFSFETDDEGGFEMMLPASKEREYNLVVHDGAFQEWRKWGNGVNKPFRTESGDELTDVELWLSYPGTVRGVVVDKSRKPVIGREVRAHAFDKLGNRYYDPTTKTGKDGSFELAFIRPGKHYIQASPFWLYAEESPWGTSQLVEVKAGEIVEGVQLVGE